MHKFGYCMDNIAILKKRILYRSNYRGCRETDLIIGSYAKLHIDKLSAAQLAEFDLILEENDHDLYDWISQKSSLPPKYSNSMVMSDLIKFKLANYSDHGNEHN